MDLGLGNLADVKGFVLPEAIRADMQYDAVLQVIASGIAERFSKYCNRKFSRVVDELVTFDAMRTFYLVPRFPFEVITKLEIRATTTDAWDDITTAIVQSDPAIGWIYFGCFIGDPICLVRCTYTGGFFYEAQEPLLADGVTANPAYPTAAPAGSFPVPPDLKGAWLMQTLHEFQCKDRLLPVGLVDATKSRSDLRFEQMQLLPEVQNALDTYRRYSML
jgi:hypothetical protein